MQRNEILKFGPFFSIVIAFVISILIIKPKVEEVLQARTEIESQMIKVERLTQKESFLKGLDSTDLKSKIQLTVEAIPSDKDVPSFLSALDFLAKEASVSVIAVQTSPGKMSTSAAEIALAVSKEAADAVPLNITLEGKLDEVRFFLGKMLTSLPLQSLQAFSFNFQWNKNTAVKEEKPNVFGPIAANFSLAYYYKYLPKEIGKVSDLLPKTTPKDQDTFTKLGGFLHLPTVTSLVPVGREDPFSRP